MFMNNWYVACSVNDVKPGEPYHVKMLGADFVLFRDENNEIVCMSDVCIHRGAALSAGKVHENGCIACPYHGWQFDKTGACVKIPALGADVTPPTRARVDVYPVREKFGWVWTFLGDAPEEERPPFPEDDMFPEYYDPENWRPIVIDYVSPLNWMRAEENSIDGAHPSFVHAAFGSKRDPKVMIVPVEKKDEWSASTTRQRTPPDRSQKSGKMKELTAEVRGKTTATTAFTWAGITHRIAIDRADGLKMRTISHRTPIDNFSTRTLTIQVRNYLLEPEYDQERIDGRNAAISEDVATVSTVRPRLQPRLRGEELLTEADQLETAFREIIRRQVEKGWEIDAEEVARLYDRQVLVIPSPKRNESQNWVHKPVPTTRERKGEVAAEAAE